MLKINIGLSHKLSENFNSHGFSLNLEDEVCVDLRDTETVVERIQEYYDLADEALSHQIERYESDTAIASRDEVLAPAKKPAAEGSADQLLLHHDKGCYRVSDSRRFRQRG